MQYSQEPRTKNKEQINVFCRENEMMNGGWMDGAWLVT
jgi:hypothetical protein